MFTKMFGPPPLANDYSYADRTTTATQTGRLHLRRQDDYDDHGKRRA